MTQASCSALVAGLLCAGILAGCATSGQANPEDPLEGYNRAMFRFNEQVDRIVLKPLAQGYETVTPLPVRTGVGNFFGNLGDIWIGANDLLQGKGGDALNDVGRLAVNTTLGILGLFDVASDMGLDKHDEDFGQTLGVWGVDEGPYFVIPVLGPSTVRDALATPVDLVANSFWEFSDIPTRNSLTGLRMVHQRASLLGVEKTLDEGTLDKYSYSRDFFLQQRRYKVFDGKPPKRPDDEGARLDDLAAPIGAVAAAAVESVGLAALGADPDINGEAPR